MERFFILDKFNTWYDWGLIVTAKEITPPEPKTNYVEIGGANGTLDLSESLTGEVVYNDRTISASFWTSEGSYKDREKLLRNIVAVLHGKKIKIIEPDDPTHYFYGRVTVKSVTNILPYMEFSIEATCEPWRYAVDDSERRIEIYNSSVDAVIINNGVKTLSPIITVSGSVDIRYNGVTVSLTEGSYRLSNVKLYNGVNVIGVSGRGSVIFTYKEALL